MAKRGQGHGGLSKILGQIKSKLKRVRIVKYESSFASYYYWTEKGKVYRPQLAETRTDLPCGRDTTVPTTHARITTARARKLPM